MRKRIAAYAAALTVTLLLSACQGKKQAEARLIGIEQMKNQDYAGAVETFDQVLALSKGKAGELELDVLKYRAEAEYQLEDYAAAADTYGVLLEAYGDQPEYYDCRLYRGLASVKAGDFVTAVGDYMVVYGKILADGDAAAITQLMGFLELLGSQPEIKSEYWGILMTLYEQALDSGHASGAVYNRMGLLLMESEEYDRAISFFEQGLALEDDRAREELLFNQAVAYEYKSDFQTALQLFERYRAEFGSDEAVEKEIAFLKTR